MNLKKGISIAVFLFLLINTGVHAQGLNCKDLGVEGLCIDIEFISVQEDFKTPSEYEFPGIVKINDYLVIKKITAINKPGIVRKNKPGIVRKNKPGIVRKSKNTTNVKLNIDVSPTGFDKEEIAKFESTGYAFVDIPPLKVNDVFELTYQNEWGRYGARLNSEVLNDTRYNMYPKKLFTDGDWEISETIGGVGSTTIINGDWKNNLFKVYSNLEIANLEIAKKSLKIADRNLIIGELSIIVVLLIAIITTLGQRRLAKNLEVSLKEITQELSNRMQDLTTSAEKEAKGGSSITMAKKEDKAPIVSYLISVAVPIIAIGIMLLPETENLKITDKIQAIMITTLVYLTFFYVRYTNKLAKSTNELAGSSEKNTLIQIYENRLEKLYSPLRLRTNFLQIRDETLMEIRKYSYLGTPKLNKILEEYFEKMENANYANVKGVVMKKDLKHDDPENVDLQKRLMGQIKADYDQILKEYKQLIES